MIKRNFITSVAQKYVVWKVRVSHRLRSFIGAFCHFFFKSISGELSGQRDHSTLVSNATYSPWRINDEFCAVFNNIASYSLLDKMRLYELWQLANQVSHLEGDAIEIGCWRGGSGCLIAGRIAQNSKDTRMFLCDTFNGVVKAGCHDKFYQGNELADSSETMVSNLAKQMGIQNITIFSGIFPEETGSQLEDNLFKFAHIDVDVYQSARDAFEWLFPRLINGAIVVFDDYGFASTPGVRKYVDELQSLPDVVIIRNLNGQAVIIKR